MKMVNRRVLLVGLAFCATGFASEQVLGNGDAFFEAAEIPGQTEYVVFGSVKDEQGKFLDHVTVTIDVANPLLTYDIFTNILGRFRTLDVGRAVKDLGFELNVSNVTLTATLPGYHVVQKMYRGKAGQNKGAVETNFVMAKDDPGKAK